MYIQLHEAWEKPLKQGSLTLKIRNIKDYHSIIQSENIEKIALDVLNNSKYLMKSYQPFIMSKSQANGESDNIGKGYEIDTKLLAIQSMCYDISKNGKALTENNRKYEMFWKMVDTYCQKEKQMSYTSEFSKNHLELFEKLENTFQKYKHKNLLFLYPFPIMDCFLRLRHFENNYQKNRSAILDNFEDSYMYFLFLIIRNIAKKTNYNKDVFIAYCLYDNTYNLVQIRDNTFQSEAFISSKEQLKAIIVEGIGMTSEGVFYPMRVERKGQVPMYSNNRFYKKNFNIYESNQEIRKSAVTKGEDIKTRIKIIPLKTRLRGIL